MRKNPTRVPNATVSQSSERKFPFLSLATGIWDYDHLGKLIFDSKFKDHRVGTITFGKSALVVYLEAGHAAANWHCRLDIPYSIVEHVIPSEDNGRRSTITFTLETPPKIYQIVNTGDLHLYSGGKPVTVTTDRRNFESPKRLLRICAISDAHEKNSALCMVYRFVLPDVTSAQRVRLHLSKFSALSQIYPWKTMVPVSTTDTIEIEYSRLENVLSNWEADSLKIFTFDLRFQLLALVLKGTLSPSKVLRLLERIRVFCTKYGTDSTGRAIRKLGFGIPTPGPAIDSW
jgi:hypothetical protein